MHLKQRNIGVIPDEDRDDVNRRVAFKLCSARCRGAGIRILPVGTRGQIPCAAARICIKQ